MRPSGSIPQNNCHLATIVPATHARVWKNIMNDFDERRTWFDDYLARFANELPPELLPCNTCPCCGYPTLGERGAFDICALC